MKKKESKKNYLLTKLKTAQQTFLQCSSFEPIPTPATELSCWITVFLFLLVLQGLISSRCFCVNADALREVAKCSLPAPARPTSTTPNAKTR